MDSKHLLSRRKFIQYLTIAVSSYPISSLAINRKQSNISKPDKEPWQTLSKVQEHLFPSEQGSLLDSLGAEDINALVYLQNMMETPEFPQDEKELINNGVTWLDELSKKKYAKKFTQINADEKEKILRQIENSNAGSRWLSLLLTYLLQAIVADPIYGGNPKGIGWQWLEHQPGFPRPVESKKYFKLKQRRTRTIKA